MDGWVVGSIKPSRSNGDLGLTFNIFFIGGSNVFPIDFCGENVELHSLKTYLKLIVETYNTSI